MSGKNTAKAEKKDPLAKTLKPLPITQPSIADAKLEVMQLLIEQKNSEIEYLRGLVKILVSEPEEEAGHVENS